MAARAKLPHPLRHLRYRTAIPDYELARYRRVGSHMQVSHLIPAAILKR